MEEGEGEGRTLRKFKFQDAEGREFEKRKEEKHKRNPKALTAKVGGWGTIFV